MAIIQISKIQQRSGNLVDLPQLDEAQFGWATDAKRLFIGKTSPNENIEVLTSYSNISFSQIDGSDGGNFNISNATSGQVLTYVGTTNTWENWPSTDILTANANFKLNLGDAGNIKITGGAIGYVLETDGSGNLAWTTKGSLRANIIALSNATPIVMQVANTTPLTNGASITISGANAANANTIVNGQSFYVKVANDFATTGNVALYNAANLAPGNAVAGTDLGTYTSNSGVMTASLGGAGSSNAGGSVNTIQFNDGGILNGSANFTITGGNLVSLTGNLSASNVAGGNLVTANFFTGTLTTAAQPNITSTGTLAGLVVAGNITPSANITYNLGNNTNRFNDIYLANSTIYIGDQTIGANATNVIISGVLTANVSGNATTAGTVTTAAQPNITSVGTLTSVSVSGNANVGNLNTGGLITATGNLNAGNIITGGIVSATGNITGGNVITSGIVSATGNGTFGNVSATTFTGALSGAATTAGTVTTAAQPNITSTGTLASLSVTGNANIGNIGTAGLITATGNLNAGNIITGGIVSATGNANVGNLGTSGLITATGDLNAGNIITAGIISATGNANVGNLGTTGIVATSLSASANANVGNLGTAGLITATGNINGGNIITTGIVSATGNITANFFIGNGSQLTGITVAAGSSIVNGNSNVTVNANSNVTISAVGTSNVVVITNTGANIAGTLSVSGNITSGNIALANASIISANNMQLTTGANTNAGNITGNWSLTAGSRLNATYADLAEYYEADAHYEPGTVLEFGGDKEVTLAQDGTTRVAGVVSTNPAYAMNANCQGISVAIALQGRVPTKVRGSVHKGDMMVSAGNGYARPWNNPHMGTVIGKALENFDGIEGVIEVAVGRL